MILLIKIASAGFDDTYTEGLIGYWNFDNNSLDWSGNGNDGIDWNIKNSTGKINDSYYFDGTGDYVDVGSFQHNITSLTISLWFNTTSQGSADEDCFISKWSLTLSQDAYLLRYDSNNNQIDWYTGNGTATYGSSNNVVIENNGWHHLVAIWNGTDSYIYLDNVMQPNTKSMVGQIGQNANPLNTTIGRYTLATSDDFTGNIDEVIIWNRTINSTEIMWVYQNGTENKSLGNYDEAEPPFDPMSYIFYDTGNKTKNQSNLGITHSNWDSLSLGKWSGTANANYTSEGQNINGMGINCSGDCLPAFNFNGTLNDMTFQASFYDDNDTNPLVYSMFGLFNGSDLSDRIGYIGIYQSGVSGSVYNYTINPNPNSAGQFNATMIPRTVGWHNFSFYKGDTFLEYYIDGTMVLNETGETGEIRTIKFWSEAHLGSFWDEIYIWNGTQDDRPEPKPLKPQIFITLLFPTNNYIAIDEYATFKFNVSGINETLTNATLIINGKANQTDLSIDNYSFNYFYQHFPEEGLFNYSINVSDSAGNIGNSSIYKFQVDYNPWEINGTFALKKILGITPTFAVRWCR